MPHISVIIPVYNGRDLLTRSLKALRASSYTNYECIVADDGSTQEISGIAASFDAKIVRIADGPRGPAHARNAGAAAASGDLLVFIDADVLVTPGTLQQFADAFANHPDIDAAFGSYDDAPATSDFVSQFKNLFHHFVHQHSNEEASTFWSGCGAVRRQVFLEAGGFDAGRYNRPCIEDIELGYRLRDAGRRIRLLKSIQVKHLKRWSLRDMVRTDVFDRGVPWTILLLEKKRLPNDLNLQLTQRLSGMLSYSILLYAGLIAYFHTIFMLPFVAALFLMVAGSMDWSDKTLPFHMISRRAEVICYCLIGVVLALAVTFDVTRMYLPLSVLFFGMVGGRLLPLSSRLGRRFFFTVVLAGLSATVAMLLSRFSFPVVAPLLVAILLVVLLNFPLYLFFTRKRGLAFALVALPMHLFYFCYALAALGIGAARFLLGDGRRRVATKAV